jgi:hypothetical protein
VRLSRRGGQIDAIPLALEKDQGDLLVVLVVLDHEDR